MSNRIHSGSTEKGGWCPTCLHFRRLGSMFSRSQYEDTLHLSDSLIADEHIPCSIIESTRDFWRSYFAAPGDQRTLYPHNCPLWSLSPKPYKPGPPTGQVVVGGFALVGFFTIVFFLLKGLDWLEHNTILFAIGRVLRDLYFLVSFAVILGGALITWLITWIKRRRSRLDYPSLDKFDDDDEDDLENDSEQQSDIYADLDDDDTEEDDEE